MSNHSAASATRRATGDPNTFLIPDEHLPPGFAEKVESGAFEPVAPRPAATVVLLREGAAAPEALLLRRHRRSGFAADAWVFPGGMVDAADRDPALAERLDGPTPAEWSARLGLADAAEAQGYVAAALREAFEETGILLARPDGAGAPEGPPAGSLEAARAALLDGTAGMRELAAANGVRLAGGELLYVAHWITPEPEPRRYDTRFFVARVPRGAECAVHEAELVEARWLPPVEAVARFHSGELKMLPPTVRTLARLAEFRTLPELWEALRAAPVPALLPRMRRHPEGVAIEVPTDANAGA
ncbi:MAG TPA: NUDIX domain-containing protein [Longimicrobiaceae bacterium]|nr:NUDIX domain-containing protein [Longimicrobiaceae bacterium]